MNLIWTKLPFLLTSLHDLQFFAISYFCSCINRPVIVITTLQFRHVTLSLKYARIDPVFEYQNSLFCSCEMIENVWSVYCVIVLSNIVILTFLASILKLGIVQNIRDKLHMPRLIASQILSPTFVALMFVTWLLNSKMFLY